MPCFKNPGIKIYLLPMGQNLLSYYILYDGSKHNIVALVGKANKQKIQVSTEPPPPTLLKTKAISVETPEL